MTASATPPVKPRYIEIPPTPWEDWGRPAGSPTPSNSTAQRPRANRTPSYPAYVQSNSLSGVKKPFYNGSVVENQFSGEQGKIFRDHGPVYGWKKEVTDLDCGKIKSVVLCSSDQSHPSHYKHHYCNDPGCPVCYGKFVHRKADAIVGRVNGYLRVYPGLPLSQVIIWPEKGARYSSLKDAMKYGAARFRVLGLRMGVLLYHPYRIRDDVEGKLRDYRRLNNIPKSVGFWTMAHDDVLNLGCLDAYIEYGPHWHCLATGKAMDQKEYQMLGIGGYKKKAPYKTMTDVERFINYAASHSMYQHHAQSVRYLGDISYQHLSRDDGRVTWDDVQCDKCASIMQVFDYSEEQGIGAMTDHHYMHKRIKYIYWKHGQPVPDGAITVQADQRRKDRMRWKELKKTYPARIPCAASVDLAGALEAKGYTRVT